MKSYSVSMAHQVAVFAAAALLFVGSVRATPAGVDVDQLHEQAVAAERSGNLQEAAAKYSEIIKAAPRLAPAYNNLGAIYFKAHQFARAVEVLQKGLQVDPHMLSASALLGMSLYQMGDYSKAQESLAKVVEANPKDTHAELTLVNTLTKLGQFQSAEQHLSHLATEEPRNQQIWYLLGRVHMQLAEEDLAKINEIDPDSVWAHEVSAEMDESMKNYDGAIVEWKKAAEKAPQQAGVHFKLGDLYWSLSQWDNATREFEAEKRIDPSNCRVDWKLGNILLQKSEDLDKALELVDASLASCPNLIGALADRGKLLVKLHREKEALGDLQAAVAANPSESSNHFVLAQAYRALGNAEQARSEMRLFSDLEQKARAAAAQRAAEVIGNRQVQ